MTSNPSNADSTEIAGVRAQSPYTSAAPNMPMNKTKRRPGFRLSSAINARTPPSPSLSTRSARMMYFTVVMMMSVHTISDSEPRTASGAGCLPAAPSTTLSV